MSISALSGSQAGASVSKLAPAPSTGFGAQLSVAVGQGHTAHGHGVHGRRSQETGSSSGSSTQATGAVSSPAAATPVHSMADDTRALVGDVFGALGASTPTQAAAQKAVQAYRQAA